MEPTTPLPQKKEDLASFFKKEIKKIEQSLEKVDEFYKKNLTWFDKFSEKVATVGGSWGFIIVFLIFVAIWVTMNLFHLATPFDPYPFALLNVIISIITGIQAPVILMSQIHAAERDRIRVELDLKKDARDLRIDKHSLEILMQLQKDVNALKRKTNTSKKKKAKK